ncbi:MAG TPA: hypothetical protein VF733_03400 [Candidatus Saccharimonadales bacterium]
MKTKRPTLIFRLAGIGLVVGIFGLVAVPVWAQNQSGAISRGFTATDSELVQGALVSTKSSNPDVVELATAESAARLAGIVSNNALVELSNTQPGEVQVLLNGNAQALVSDLNGPIKAGDKITASPLSGIGMLATEDAQIVGTAQSDFTLKNSKTKVITDKNGKTHTVHVGTVPLQIAISYYIAPTSQFMPAFLQNLANSIAGRPVSVLRILISCVLLFFAFGSITILIYTSVRSGIISLGRNPLAASAIQRGLISVIIIVVLTAILSLGSVYLILTT